MSYLQKENAKVVKTEMWQPPGATIEGGGKGILWKENFFILDDDGKEVKISLKRFGDEPGVPPAPTEGEHGALTAGALVDFTAWDGEWGLEIDRKTHEGCFLEVVNGGSGKVDKPANGKPIQHSPRGGIDVAEYRLNVGEAFSSFLSDFRKRAKAEFEGEEVDAPVVIAALIKAAKAAEAGENIGKSRGDIVEIPF